MTVVPACPSVQSTFLEQLFWHLQTPPHQTTRCSRQRVNAVKTQRSAFGQGRNWREREGVQGWIKSHNNWVVAQMHFQKWNLFQFGRTAEHAPPQMRVNNLLFGNKWQRQYSAWNRLKSHELWDSSLWKQENANKKLIRTKRIGPKGQAY